MISGGKELSFKFLFKEIVLLTTQDSELDSQS